MRKLIYIIMIMAGSFLRSFAQQYEYANDPLFEAVLIDEFDSLGLDLNKWYGYWGSGPNMFNTNKLKGQCKSPAFLPDSTVDVAYCDWDVTGANTNNRSFDTTGTGFMRIINKRDFRTAYIFVYVNGVFDHGEAAPFKFSTSVALSKLKFKYGYFEMRYRLSNVPEFSSTYPNGSSNAYGPNFWMLGSDTSCVYSEIDVFEQDGVTWKMGPNIHMRRRPNRNSSGALIGPPSGNPNDTTSFSATGQQTPGTPASVYGSPAPSGPYNGGAWHTAGCEWNDQFTEFYYDHVASPIKYKKDSIRVDYLTNMFLIIDCYVPALQYCIQWDSLKTQLPFNYDIDYVKVYQQKQDCSSQTFNNTNAGTYPSKVYKDVTITGSSAFTSGVSHICGQDFAQLNAGFEIGGNAEVIIDTRNCLPGQSANAILLNEFPNTVPPTYFKTQINEIKRLPRIN